MEERAKKIVEGCMQEKSKNPIEIFYNIAKKRLRSDTWSRTSYFRWSITSDCFL